MKLLRKLNTYAYFQDDLIDLICFQRGSCDMNCCCDRDCVHVNRDVFKKCVGVKNTEEDKYCPSKILNSPLLCVVKDNLYSRHFYPHHRVRILVYFIFPFFVIVQLPIKCVFQIAEETSNVDKLLRNREIFGWSFPSSPSEEPEIDMNFEQYEISSPVWIHDRESNVQIFR